MHESTIRPNDIFPILVRADAQREDLPLEIVQVFLPLLGAMGDFHGNSRTCDPRRKDDSKRAVTQEGFVAGVIE